MNQKSKSINRESRRRKFPAQIRRTGFAKIAVISLAIVTVIFGAIFFAKSDGQIANADAVHNDNYTYQTIDYVNFDGKSYIKTGVDQLGDIGARVDFELSEEMFPLTQGRGGNIFGSRGNGGWRDSSFYLEVNGPRSSFSFIYSTNAQDLISINQTDIDRHVLVQRNGLSEFYANGALVASFDKIDVAPQNASEIYLGNIRNGDAGIAPLGFSGKIYSFQISKGQCSDPNFTNQTDCETAAGSWAQITVRDLIPAVRYSGCGENFSVEYGFIDAASDEKWYGNSGSGTLTGSPEIIAPTCPTTPEIPPITPIKPEAPDAILPPNTGAL